MEEKLLAKRWGRRRKGGEKNTTKRGCGKATTQDSDRV
jgi:hypothetical protein